MEFNHKPAKFYCPKKEREESTPPPTPKLSQELTDNMVKHTANSYLYSSPRWLHRSAVSEHHITTTTHIVVIPAWGLFQSWISIVDLWMSINELLFNTCIKAHENQANCTRSGSYFRENYSSDVIIFTRNLKIPKLHIHNRLFSLELVAMACVSIHYNTHSTQKKPSSTQKYPVWHKNTWFDTKMPGSTEKCPTQHASVAIAIIKHTHPSS